MLHKTRELLVKQRTMSVNALRGHLSEFGIIAAKGIGRVDELLDLVESDTTLPNAGRAGVMVLAQALEGLDKAIDDLEDEITNAHAQNEMTRLLYKVPGIGKIIASVIAASVPDPSAKAPCATGLLACWRRNRRGWLRWRWPTSSPGSSGR